MSECEGYVQPIECRDVELVTISPAPAPSSPLADTGHDPISAIVVAAALTVAGIIAIGADIRRRRAARR